MAKNRFQPIPKRAATPLPAIKPFGRPDAGGASRESTLGTFIESDCEVGGCYCGRWNDWLWHRIEFVQQHPRAADFCSLTDDEKMDAEDELLAELELAGDLPESPNLPPCEQPTCKLFPPEEREEVPA